MNMQLDASSPPCLPLAVTESQVHATTIEYLDRAGVAWLTTHRIMVRATQPNATLQARIDAAATPAERDELAKVQQFQLPLANVTGHMVSAAKDLNKLMLKLNYTTEKGSANVIFRFTGPNALADRTRWKEILTERQTATATPSPAAAPIVKTEPGLPTPPPAVAAPVAQQAMRPIAPAVAPPAVTLAAPRAPGAGKRPHSAMSGTAAASSSAAVSIAPTSEVFKVRAALLARDPALQSVHAELVPQAVSEEEFWSGRSELIRAEQQRQSAAAGTGGPPGAQRAGISSTMASAIRPETGCNTVKYTLDASQIHSIFLENPMIYELYQQLVPDTLDEKTFWTKYFKSQYIHSQATTSVSNELNKNVSEEDLFAKVNRMAQEKENEALGIMVNARTTNNTDPAAAAQALSEAEDKKDVATKATLLQRKIDPSVDLTAADLPNAVLQADPSKSGSGSVLGPMSNTTRSKKARAQTELLQRFNRHGMLVLDSSLNGTEKTRNVTPATSNLTATELRLQTEYHHSLASSLNLIDLSEEATPTYNTLAIGQNAFASLGARKQEQPSAESLERVHQAKLAFAKELEQLPGVADTTNRHQTQHLPPSLQSRNILLELTSTARGMNKAAIAAKQLKESSPGEGQAQQLIVFSTGDEPDMLIPDQFRDELKKRYHTCTELFRHFWSSLNTRTAAKLQRVHSALDEQHRLLQVIRTSLNSRGYSQLVPLLNPLVASIEMCAQTYQKWNEKEAKKTSAPVKRMINTGPSPQPSASPTEEPDSKRMKL